MMKEFAVVLFLAAFTLVFVDGVRSKDDVSEAIIDGDKQKLLDLIENGTDINKCLHWVDGKPLSLAIREKNEEIALLLIEKGADLNVSCYGVKHRSLLADATEAGLKTLVKVLFEKGVEFEDKFLWDIIQNDKIDVLEFILQNGFDPNKEYDDCNQTWLYQAVIYGCVNITKLLLKKGADIEHKDCDGRTAFNWACFSHKGHDTAQLLIRGLEILIDSGANVNTPDNIDKITPLMCAADCGFTTVVEKLIEKGADINAKDIDNRTALHQVDDTDIAEILIEKGADVNAMDKEGNTPWSLASKYRNEKLAKFWLEHGADIHKGETLRKKLAENKPQSRK